MLDIGEETAAIARISTKVSEEDPAYCKMEGDTALHKTEEGMSMSMSIVVAGRFPGTRPAGVSTSAGTFVTTVLLSSSLPRFNHVAWNSQSS